MPKPLKNITSKRNLTCLICGNKKLIEYLNLGSTALANSYLDKKNLGKKESKFPLRSVYCTVCHLAQLGDIVDRKHIFENYAYFSSTSPQLEEYFKKYADDIYKKFPKQTKKLTLEIASNDGILLKYFQILGAPVLGIDPAKNIAKIANKKGLLTISEFFNLKTATKILNKYGKAGIISANNVLAHVDNVDEIISGVKNLLTQDGVFVFEVQYLGDLLAKNEFDNTYHEHISYFSLSPLETLLLKNKLQIFNIERVSGQGGSLRVYASHHPLVFKISSSVKKIKDLEKKQGLHKKDIYLKFGKTPIKIKKDLREFIQKLKKQNKKIVGYGASAKGNTLLQYCGVDSSMIDYIVDTAPSKQGKYTPGSHIPIYGTEHLKKNTPDYVLLLAWNYADSIMAKEKWLTEKGVKFIKPIPNVKIL